MKRYFKRIVEGPPPLGGVVWFEFDGEIPLRQVERYGVRWYDSRSGYHADLGPGLTDQPPEVLGLGRGDEIDAREFEEAWAAATRAGG
jgi:hypothetical protein